MLHGLAAISLLHSRETPVDEGAAMEVILTSPPRTTALSKSAPARGPSQAPKLAAAPKAELPKGKGDNGAFDWRVRVPAREPEEVRGTLRSKLGCERAKFLALTAEEQAACDEKLAEDAREARAYAVISPKLKKQFDGVFECPKDDVWCEYRIGKAPYPGLLQLGRKKRSEWD